MKEIRNNLEKHIFTVDEFIEIINMDIEKKLDGVVEFKSEMIKG